MRARLTIVVTMLVGLNALPISNAYGRAEFHYKEFAQGAIATFFDCDEAVPFPPICHEYRVYYARFDAAIDGGPTNRGKQPFVAAIEIFTYDTAAGEIIAFEFGETTDVIGTWDRTKLSFARMDAPAPIQLMEFDFGTGEFSPSGRVATLGPVTWTSIAPRRTYGNDGPALDDLGVVRHLGTRCEVENHHAHQKIRPADVTPLALRIDGTPVAVPFQAVPAGFVINNWFHVVVISKDCS